MSRHLVDLELLQPLDAFPPLDITMEALPGLRAQMKSFVQPIESNAIDSVAIERCTVPGYEGAPDVGIILYRPSSPEPRPALLYIHGGGYIFGSSEDIGPSAVKMASEIGCMVVSVEYRLAPETRSPGSVEDCYAALLWLTRDAHVLGVDPKRIAIGGESAGGGLAAALALLARDRGECMPCFQLLIYPMLDDRTVIGPANPHTGHFVWTRDANHFGWESLLGRSPGSSDVTGYEAAARAKDLTGLPPAFISVGALDLFLDEDIAYATRLMSAGVPSELHVYPGAFHGFEMAQDAAVTRTALSDRYRALRRAFAHLNYTDL